MNLIDKILDATSEADLCACLRDYIFRLTESQQLKKLPVDFHVLSAENAADIEGWYEALKKATEGDDSTDLLQDVYGVYHAAIQALRKLGLRT